MTQSDFGWITIRIDPKMKRKLDKEAARLERSTAQQVRLLIKEWLNVETQG